MYAIFLDTETTGLDPWTHHPIELAFVIVDLQKNKRLVNYQTLIALEHQDWDKSDPNSLIINGFDWEKIRNAPSIHRIKKQIIQIFTYIGIQRGSAFFVCQNPTFDRTFFSKIVDVYTQEKLNWPYHWLDLASMFWALHVKDLNAHNQSIPDQLSLSKNDIAERFGLPPEKTPHTALQGVDHLINCYEAVMNVRMCSKTSNAL